MSYVIFLASGFDKRAVHQGAHPLINREDDEVITLSDSDSDVPANNAAVGSAVNAVADESLPLDLSDEEFLTQYHKVKEVTDT